MPRHMLQPGDAWWEIDPTVDPLPEPTGHYALVRTGTVDGGGLLWVRLLGKWCAITGGHVPFGKLDGICEVIFEGRPDA